MSEPAVRDLKTFVPCKDFDVSIRFYKALGWKLNWQDDSELAEIELAGVRLFLQKYHVEEWASNFMIYIDVDDAQAWHRHVETILENHQFPNARTQPPQKETYGALVTYAWDPSGVLLHFAQQMDSGQ